MSLLNPEQKSNVNPKGFNICQITSDLLYKELLYKIDNYNSKNSDFIRSFERWFIDKLEKYKRKKLRQGLGWKGLEDVNKFKKSIVNILNRVFNVFAFHGKSSNDGIVKKIDLDAEASLILLQECGLHSFDENSNQFKKIEIVGHGEKFNSAFNLDTGSVNGIDISLGINNSFFSSTGILDHHPNGPASTVYMLFEILLRLDAIPKNKKLQIKRFVQFVNIVDTFPFEKTDKLYLNSHQTIFGLASFLKAKFIYSYFKKNNTGLEILSESEMDETIKDKNNKTTTLRELGEKRKKFVQRSINDFSISKNKGMIVGDGKNGEYIVDMGNNITNGPEVSSYFGYGLFKIFPEGDIFISLKNDFDPRLLELGLVIRNKMFFLKKHDENYEEKLEKLLDLFFEIENVSRPSLLNQIKEYSKQQIKIYQINKKNKQFEQNSKILLERENEEKLKLSIEQVRNENLINLSRINEFPIGIDLTNSLSGDIVFQGVVVSISSYGVFIDIGGIKGLLHKNNTSSIQVKKDYHIGKIVPVGISKIVYKNGKKVFSFY